MNEPRPIMEYVSKLESQVRLLKWKLSCNRVGSFVTGFFIGFAGGMSIATIILVARGCK